MKQSNFQVGIDEKCQMYPTTCEQQQIRQPRWNIYNHHKPVFFCVSFRFLFVVCVGGGAVWTLE
jgi:hypothetical protein